MNDLVEANAVAGMEERISGTVRLEGVVEHGDARGRELGYPTANISIEDAEVRDGVWAGTVRLGPDGRGETYAAAISVGRRPTYYPEGVRLLEAYLLGFSGDLYGQTVSVTLHVYIRPQQTFHQIDQLVLQIEDDVECVKSWVAGREQEKTHENP